MKNIKTEQKKDIVMYGKTELERDSMLGLSQVPLTDIRPPQILLIQKSSELADFADTEGNQPKIGQFFHTGKMQILDSFECYFLLAAKGKYINKIKPEEGEKDQYKAIAVMADDLSIFGMVFRSSALFALSPIFTASLSQKRPMFSIRAKIETKSLSNDKGTWFVPVCRIQETENDQGKLAKLYEMAKRYDAKAKEFVPDTETEENELDETIKDKEAEEVVNDIPF